jgi:ADP-ribose pyrophosphatase
VRLRETIRVKIRSVIKNVEKHTAYLIGNHLWSPVSVSVFSTKDDKVLVLENAGKHCLPGGLNTGGEKLKQTGRREVKEETGCDVNVGKILEISREKGRSPGVHFYFEAEIEKVNLEGSWEGRPKLIDRQKLRDLDWELHHSHVHEYLFPEN